MMLVSHPLVSHPSPPLGTGRLKQKSPRRGQGSGYCFPGVRTPQKSNEFPTQLTTKKRMKAKEVTLGLLTSPEN